MHICKIADYVSLEYVLCISDYRIYTLIIVNSYENSIDILYIRWVILESFFWKTPSKCHISNQSNETVLVGTVALSWIELNIYINFIYLLWIREQSIVYHSWEDFIYSCLNSHAGWIFTDFKLLEHLLIQMWKATWLAAFVEHKILLSYDHQYQVLISIWIPFHSVATQ